ncbi:hypothetical protein O3G_MSEX005875 [Manduca sexta]|uniref:Uncharacterized protein n=1 Tax=Manduca sexta TaxID=7130 RepID=A0A922CKD3_MANSE|nr:hypothetical protein O3G_MSEX005875 [Manduca sexta]
MVHENPLLTDDDRLYYLVSKLSTKAKHVFSAQRNIDLPASGIEPALQTPAVGAQTSSSSGVSAVGLSRALPPRDSAQSGNVSSLHTSIAVPAVNAAAPCGYLKRCTESTILLSTAQVIMYARDGPNLQGDLNCILLNFRLFKIAVSADCRQMFLQIVMNESDRKFQRILFRFHANDPVSIFEFNRVCFGMKSSVFHAVRVVKQLIADEGHKFPVAAAIASDSTYMDDVCFSIMADDSSQSDESVVVDACIQLIDLFKCGQFDLVKWTSNSAAVLRAIPASHLASSDLEIDKGAVPHKILGTHWNRSDDAFNFKVATPEPGCSKRIILSTVARLWDNLGLVAPVVLYAKLLIRELWLAKCDWDDTPPPRIVTLWSRFCSELPTLNEVRIPRHLGVVQGCVVNLLGFADASERAYGAVLYMQTVVNNRRNIVLLCSKSKVSPLKTVSIARLELCAAVILSKLMRKIIDLFGPRYKISNIYAFTDSKVTLCWINSSPHRWQTFVANRVVKVIDNIPASCFHHIAGVENPADCLSRGLSPASLIDHPLWFSGPPWVSKDPTEWPIEKFDKDEVGDVPDLKPLAHAVTVPAIESPIYSLALQIA